MADRIAVPRGVLRLDWVVRTPVNRDHAKRVALGVEEDQLRRRLDDLAGRSHARDAGRLAVEGRIFLDALPIEVLHAAPEFRLVHRNRIHALLDSRIALEIHRLRAVAEVLLLLRAWALLEDDREVALLVGLVAAAAATAPHAGEVRMTVNRPRGRNVLLLPWLLRVQRDEGSEDGQRKRRTDTRRRPSRSAVAPQDVGHIHPRKAECNAKGLRRRLRRGTAAFDLPTILPPRRSATHRR